MSTIKKIAKVARTTQAVGRFCMNPLCLHVAGKAKCRSKCCKV